jgi:hypothetical protein
VSTATGPDLSTAREAVEALMDDTCEISWDAQGVGDDVLDEETGDLLAPDPDSGLVYDATTLGDGGRELGGRCKVASIGRDPRTTTEGGVAVLTGLYNGSIPWDAPVPPVGATFKITSSRRDPDLVGQEFIVKDVAFGTFLISRKMTLEIRR